MLLGTDWLLGTNQNTLTCAVDAEEALARGSCTESNTVSGERPCISTVCEDDRTYCRVPMLPQQLQQSHLMALSSLCGIDACGCFVCRALDNLLGRALNRIVDTYVQDEVESNDGV